MVHKKMVRTVTIHAHRDDVSSDDASGDDKHSGDDLNSLWVLGVRAVQSVQYKYSTCHVGDGVREHGAQYEYSMVHTQQCSYIQ